MPTRSIQDLPGANVAQDGTTPAQGVHHDAAPADIALHEAHGQACALLIERLHSLNEVASQIAAASERELTELRDVAREVVGFRATHRIARKGRPGRPRKPVAMADHQRAAAVHQLLAPSVKRLMKRFRSGHIDGSELACEFDRLIQQHAPQVDARREGHRLARLAAGHSGRGGAVRRYPPRDLVLMMVQLHVPALGRNEIAQAVASLK